MERQPTFLSNSWPSLGTTSSGSWPSLGTTSKGSWPSLGAPAKRPSSPTDELMRSLGHSKARVQQDRTPAFAHQDWSKTTIRNPLVAKAQAQAAAPPPRTASQAVGAKLENSEIAGKLKQLSAASRQEIVNRRVANKWSQADLNTQCCFPANTIREIEAGRTPPTIGQLNKLNQVLKTGLKFA